MYFGSPSEIASNAHSGRQVPHIVHSSDILYATFTAPFFKLSHHRMARWSHIYYEIQALEVNPPSYRSVVCFMGSLS